MIFLQTKLRLEMNAEKTRQQHNRDIEEKETEMEEVRAAAQKRVSRAILFWMGVGEVVSATLFYDYE